LCNKCSSNFIIVSDGASCGCNDGLIDTGSSCQQPRESSGLSGNYLGCLYHLIEIGGAIAGIVIGAVAAFVAASFAVF